MTIPLRTNRLVAVCLAMMLVASCAQPSKNGIINAPAAPPPSTVSIQASAPEKSATLDARMIAAAQKALAQLGYQVGTVDGVYGPATRLAIQAFQRDRGLPEDGQVTASLIVMLTNVAAQAPKINSTAVLPGDLLLYGDGSRDTAKSAQLILWDADTKGGIVAIRPSTAGWPPAARAGLDWAVSHALDVAGGPPIPWSSTGVQQKFTIFATPVLTSRETALADRSARICRHLEIRAEDRHYPGIACRDKNGEWYFLKSKIRLAHPARVLGTENDLPMSKKSTLIDPR